MPDTGFFNAARGVLFDYEHKNFDWLWQTDEPHGTTEIVLTSGVSRGVVPTAQIRAGLAAGEVDPVCTWGCHAPKKRPHLKRACHKRGSYY